jgi:hypothetical protein
MRGWLNDWAGRLQLRLAVWLHRSTASREATRRDPKKAALEEAA